MAEDAVPDSFGGKRIDQLCDRFEAAWKTGQRPQLEDYLGEVAESDQLRLLEELLSLELDYRCQAGETPTPDDYRDRFPGQVIALSKPPSGKLELPGGPGICGLVMSWATLNLWGVALWVAAAWARSGRPAIALRTGSCVFGLRGIRL